MKQPKHTKGPWVIELSEIDLARITTKDIGVCLTDYANAHLIAAAPDMYEALEEVLRCLPEQMSLDGETIRDTIKSALNKARGES